MLERRIYDSIIELSNNKTTNSEFEKAKNLDEVQNINHYTSFNILKNYIFKNKTLKATRIDLVNDLIEQNMSNLVRVNRDLINSNFITCFCADENESIPMWFIYARSKGNKSSIDPIKEGVRLTFPVDVLKELVNNLNIRNIKNEIIESDISQENVNKKIPLIRNTILFKIIYDDKKANTDLFRYVKGSKVEKADPFQVNNIPDLGGVDGHLCGVYKTLPWSYENEVRLRISILSNGYDPFGKKINDYDYKCIFIELSELVMKRIIVTINPFVNECEFSEMKNKLLKNNEWLSEKQIKKSNLMGKLKF